MKKPRYLKKKKKGAWADIRRKYCNFLFAIFFPVTIDFYFYFDRFSFIEENNNVNLTSMHLMLFYYYIIAFALL